jgi:hypothetical protein
MAYGGAELTWLCASEPAKPCSWCGVAWGYRVLRLYLCGRALTSLFAEIPRGLKYLSSSAMTNTSLRERLKMHEKQRTQVSNLIRDAVEAGRIKHKDPASSSSKFAEYIPYWA